MTNATQRSRRYALMKCRSFRQAINLGLVVCSVVVTSAVHAEYFGLPSGRLAQIGVLSEISVEAGYSTGEISESDYSQKNLRINYRLDDDLMVYGDFGKSEVNRSEEDTLGIGAFFELGKVFDFTESITVKGSVHQFSVNRTSYSGGCNSGTELLTNPYDGTLTVGPTLSCSSSSSSRKVTGKALSLELLMSGKPVEQLQFQGVTPSWYANAGVHTFTGINFDTAMGVGAGLVYTLSKSQVYVGADFIDEVVLGVGIRYRVR